MKMSTILWDPFVGTLAMILLEIIRDYAEIIEDHIRNFEDKSNFHDAEWKLDLNWVQRPCRVMQLGEKLLVLSGFCWENN